MENMKNAFDTFTAQADTFLAKSTSAQRNYIGSLLYKAGMGFSSTCKVAEYCGELTNKEASTVISYLKAHGIKGLDMYDSEEEVVPERIRDILTKSFTTL